MQTNILDYLNNIVKVKPDKLAFADAISGMTFKEIYDGSRSIASYIHSNDIYGKPIVVFMHKSPQEITAFLGVIQAGCYYVPIDEEMPVNRIQLILGNIQSPIIICDDDTYENAKVFDFSGGIVLYDDIVQTLVDGKALADIYNKAIDTDPIYIVFTSGSTGVPKGVAACHRSVIDYIEQLSATLGFNENTIFGNQAPLYFDACLKELYPTLKFGATTYLIPRELFMLPIQLVEFLNTHKINTICWVVSALTMISAFDTFETIVPQYLSNVVFGSEIFPIKQLNRWRKALPQACFTNLYGPTEGTGMCCFYKVDREFALDETIPIGRPFKNTDIILLTENNKRATKGETGEICIRGTSLTLGYYNNFEKTAESFVQNPLNPYLPELIYRTGDIGYENEYGELVFVSRKDYQIKHMGHRIELGEIEANVNMIDGIEISGCVYDDIRGKIVLYYVGEVHEKELALSLRDKLPRYMFPNRIIKLKGMPMTPNGKLDRKKLKETFEKLNNL